MLRFVLAHAFLAGTLLSSGAFAKDDASSELALNCANASSLSDDEEKPEEPTEPPKQCAAYCNWLPSPAWPYTPGCTGC